MICSIVGSLTALMLKPFAQGSFCKHLVNKKWRILCLIFAL